MDNETVSFQEGDDVLHERYGSGTVVLCEEDQCTVDFSVSGRKVVHKTTLERPGRGPQEKPDLSVRQGPKKQRDLVLRIPIEHAGELLDGPLVSLHRLTRGLMQVKVDALVQVDDNIGGRALLSKGGRRSHHQAQKKGNRRQTGPWVSH